MRGMKKLSYYIIALIGFSVFLVAVPAEASSVFVPCAISRNLTVGSQGQDVRCLQDYLRSQGYWITYSSGYFGEQTRVAVAQWQARNGIYPANGYFVVSGYNGGYSNTNLMRDAQNAIENAIDDIEDSDESDNDIEDARDELFDAVRAYFAGDYAEAIDYAEEASDIAANDRHGNNDYDKQDAKDAIEDAEDAIEDAQDEIDDADDRGRNVRDAEDLLDEAQDYLDDAEDAYDDRDYDEAVRLAEKAEDRANDAIDEL